MSDIYEDFWGIFADSGKAPENSFYKRCVYFGKSDEESVDEVHRLLHGTKTAVSHCIPYYLKLGLPLPKVGDYTMVTDFIGNPGLIYETKGVSLMPITDVPPELAARELDIPFEDWLQWRQTENKDLATRFHFTYSEDLAVLVEEIEVVYPTMWLKKTTEEGKV